MIKVYEFDKVSAMNKFIESFYEQYGECEVVQIKHVPTGTYNIAVHYLTIKLPNKGKK